jgi:hypothetical protein
MDIDAPPFIADTTLEELTTHERLNEAFDNRANRALQPDRTAAVYAGHHEY